MALNSAAFHDCVTNDIQATELMEHGYGKDLLMRSENNQSVPREEHLPFIICSGSSRYHSAGSEWNLRWMHTRYASISPLAAIPAKMLANSSTVFAWEIGYHHRQRSRNGLVSV